MSNYLVDGGDLEDIADAIRVKSGGSSPLTFPAGFISEIRNISGGGVTPLVLVATFNKTRSEAIGYEEIYELDESFSTIYDAYMAGTPITLVLQTYWDGDTPLDDPYMLYALRGIEYDAYNYPSGLYFFDSQYRNGFIWEDTGARTGHSYIETASQYNYYYTPNYEGG